MKRVYHPIHWAATLIGLACAGAELYSNALHMHEQVHNLLDPSVVMVVIVSIAVTVAFAFSQEAFRQRHVINGTMLLLAFAGAAVYVFTTTLDRVSSVRDARLEKIWTADKEIQRLLKVRDQMTYLATRERFEGTKGRPAGKGRAYEAAAHEAQIASALLAARKADLDSLGKRLSAMTGGVVSVEQASMYQPVVLPFALFLLGVFCVSFGLGGKMVKPEFNLTLQGKSADADKVLRFVRMYRAQYQATPSAEEIHMGAGVSIEVADRLRRNLLEREKRTKVQAKRQLRRVA